MLLDASVGFHWYDLLIPAGCLLLVAAGAMVYGVVYFLVNLFRELRND